MHVDISHIIRGLDRYSKAVQDGLKVACKSTADEMQTHSKARAPWTDRTGDARSGLTASWGVNQYVYYIKLANTVPYGIHLELGMGKRFEIVAPTMKKFANRPWELLKAKLEGGS